MSLTTITLEVTSPEQEALLRQFHALITEMEDLALSAPAGQVVDVCEAAVLQRGSEVGRQVLQQAVQKRIEALEKKGHRYGRVPVAERGRTVAPGDGSS
jgi:hypothetical protein